MLKCYIILGWKGLPGTNSLAYLAHTKLMKQMKSCKCGAWFQFFTLLVSYHQCKVKYQNWHVLVVKLTMLKLLSLIYNCKRFYSNSLKSQCFKPFLLIFAHSFCKIDHFNMRGKQSIQSSLPVFSVPAVAGYEPLNKGLWVHCSTPALSPLPCLAFFTEWDL